MQNLWQSKVWFLRIVQDSPLLSATEQGGLLVVAHLSQKGSSFSLSIASAKSQGHGYNFYRQC